MITWGAQCDSYLYRKVKVLQSCDSLRPHEQFSPWSSPGQNTGAGSCSLLQGIFPTQGWNSHPLQADSFTTEPRGKLAIAGGIGKEAGLEHSQLEH